MPNRRTRSGWLYMRANHWFLTCRRRPVSVRKLSCPPTEPAEKTSRTCNINGVSATAVRLRTLVSANGMTRPGGTTFRCWRMTVWAVPPVCGSNRVAACQLAAARGRHFGTTGLSGDPVVFSAEQSSDPDKGALRYLWDFGDGTTAASKTFEHRFVQPGTYDVTLRVTDDSSSSCASAVDRFKVVVNAPPSVDAARTGRPLSAVPTTWKFSTPGAAMISTGRIWTTCGPSGRMGRNGDSGSPTPSSRPATTR